MRIKILDVCEATMRRAEAIFKNDVRVIQNDDGLFDITFAEGCTLTTYTNPINQIIVYNLDVSANMWLFETDFSEVHII
jgi:hypothetical protein